MLDVTRAVLAPHTTLRLGGEADRLVTVHDRDETVETVRKGGALLVLAGGSNVVVGDVGFRGTVVLLRSAGVKHTPDGDDVLLTVEAGQPWDEVVALAVADGLAGIECLSGIPGSAGATPIQNVGAYGQEVAETIASVLVYDRAMGETREWAPAECGFAYRHSVFKHHDRYVVLAVTFRLRRADRSGPLRYAELAQALDVPPGGSAPLADVRRAVLKLRAGKGMVLDAADPDTYSVGSFFTNPVMSTNVHAAVVDRARALQVPEPAGWPAADGSVKLSAAWLIERSGFAKGYTGGRAGVGISTKHTLALTNRGTGTTTELLDLAREVRDGVRKVFDVELRPEPVLVGVDF